MRVRGVSKVKKDRGYRYAFWGMLGGTRIRLAQWCQTPSPASRKTRKFLDLMESSLPDSLASWVQASPPNKGDICLEGWGRGRCNSPWRTSSWSPCRIAERELGELSPPLHWSLATTSCLDSLPKRSIRRRPRKACGRSYCTRCRRPLQRPSCWDAVGQGPRWLLWATHARTL